MFNFLVVSISLCAAVALLGHGTAADDNQQLGCYGPGEVREHELWAASNTKEAVMVIVRHYLRAHLPPRKPGSSRPLPIANYTFCSATAPWSEPDNYQMVGCEEMSVPNADESSLLKKNAAAARPMTLSASYENLREASVCSSTPDGLFSICSWLEFSGEDESDTDLKLCSRVYGNEATFSDAPADGTGKCVELKFCANQYPASCDQ